MTKNTRLQSLVCLLCATLAGALSLSLGSSTARGELLFSDSFQYPVGPLVGQGPPAGAPDGQTGWAFVNGNPTVTAAGLLFPNVFSAGGGTSFSGTAGDHVVANLTPVKTGVVWLGFLINLVEGDDFGFAVVNLGNGGAVAPGFGVLYNSAFFGMDNDTGKKGSVVHSTATPSSTPSWLVVKLDFNAGTETLYVNPGRSMTSIESLTASARLRMDPGFQSTGFDQVGLNVGLNDSTWGFDEVRIGTTLTDVRNGD